VVTKGTAALEQESAMLWTTHLDLRPVALNERLAPDQRFPKDPSPGP
jgi:hypothetical protein